MRFLCPVDFSEASLNALDHAARMAAVCQAHLTLVYVYAEDDYLQLAHTQPDSTDSLQQQAKQHLKALVQEIREAPETKNLREVDYSLRLGDLVDIIISHAKKESVNLIIMGTTGVGTVREAYIGSNTVQVFEHAPCPVLCVPHDAGYVPIAHMVYATDYERNDHATVKRVVALANDFGAKVEVLHVDEHQTTEHDARYQKYVEEMQSYIPYKHLSFQRIRCKEDISHCLDGYMNKSQAHVLTLLTHNRNFLQKLIYRSVAKNLAYFTDSPLLIFKN